MSKQVTSFKLPTTIHNRLLEQVIKDGYGMRGKSKWVTEAIQDFLKLEDFPEMVSIAEDMVQLSEMVCLRLPESLLNELEKAVIIIRTAYPAIEGVKSNLIRASILQRIIRTTSVTEV